ncbi:hypothetical protein JCM10449v2_008100 [Rhodotorula kratochvilovae]
MKPCALLPLALLLFPSAALATPPPALQDALSAAAAATPAVALPIPVGVQARMIRRSSNVRNDTRKAEKKLDDEAERLKDRLGGVVILPPGHFNHTVKFNGTTFKPANKDKKLPESFADLDHSHRRRRRNFFEALEGHFGFGPSASKSAAVSKGTGAADAGKAQSEDGRYYWYVEDSDDQKHWRSKEGKDAKETDKDVDADKKKEKRGVGEFFENIASEVDAEGETTASSSKTAGFTTATRSASSTVTPAPTATSASAAPSVTSSASGNSTDTAWYDPTTWGTSISNSVSDEYNDLKHKIDKLSVLSKIGLAVLIIVASVLFFALIYCGCRLNQRRRRRNAAERAQASVAANRPGGHGGRAGGRSFDQRATAIPMMGFAGSSAATTGKDKGKRRSSWSLQRD